MNCHNFRFLLQSPAMWSSGKVAIILPTECQPIGLRKPGMIDWTQVQGGCRFTCVEFNTVDRTYEVTQLCVTFCCSAFFSITNSVRLHFAFAVDTSTHISVCYNFKLLLILQRSVALGSFRFGWQPSCQWVLRPFSLDTTSKLVVLQLRFQPLAILHMLERSFKLS